MPIRRMLFFVTVCVLLSTGLSSAGNPASAANAESTPTIHDRIAGMKAADGLFPTAWDGKTGKLFLQISKFDQDFLLVVSLPYGLGSNDIGLDRGRLGEERIVHFTRVGPRVLLVAPNLQYRSSSTNPMEKLAVRQSFAESVLAGFKVEAEEDGAALVDATDFLLSDSLGAGEQLADTKQGAYKLDKERSAFALENTKNFPLNTEFESILTFTTEHPAEHSLVATVTPDAHAVTLREHYSFVQLPDDGYQPRAFDPRSAFFDTSYRDYSAPLGSPLDVRLIERHRLIKKDPNAAHERAGQAHRLLRRPGRARADPQRPGRRRKLVEPGVRSCRLQECFSRRSAAAGRRSHGRALQRDPVGASFNARLVDGNHGLRPSHRRNYSRPRHASLLLYPAATSQRASLDDHVSDPRTGEIIQGRVTLGSLRSRQDYMIAEALLAPYKKGEPVSPEMQQMVLARLRQLAAHEVGHTLGLAHNFAASSIAPGTSVMDYPHPWITLDASGRPDLSHAYATGIGAWDKVSIQYGYSQFAAGTDERTALDNILNTAQASGLYFITDQDARPLGSAHPHAHLWDNGPDPAAELNRILKVRAAALARFGEDAIQPDRPLSELEDTLVPLYLLHRYQTEAAAKEIGGLDYRYALRGDGELVTNIVDPANQQKALDAVLKTLAPETLTLPESLLRILPPRAFGYPEPSNRSEDTPA